MTTTTTKTKKPRAKRISPERLDVQRAIAKRAAEDATVTAELSISGVNLGGSLVVGRSEVYSKVVRATGGFGCAANGMGKAVFVEFSDGETARWDRSDVLRLASVPEGVAFKAEQGEHAAKAKREAEVKSLTAQLPGLLVNLVVALETVKVSDMSVPAFHAFNTARTALRQLGLMAEAPVPGAKGEVVTVSELDPAPSFEHPALVKGKCGVSGCIMHPKG